MRAWAAFINLKGTGAASGAELALWPIHRQASQHMRQEDKTRENAEADAIQDIQQ